MFNDQLVQWIPNNIYTYILLFWNLCPCIWNQDVYLAFTDFTAAPVLSSSLMLCSQVFLIIVHWKLLLDGISLITSDDGISLVITTRWYFIWQWLTGAFVISCTIGLCFIFQAKYEIKKKKFASLISFDVFGILFMSGYPCMLKLCQT